MLTFYVATLSFNYSSIINIKQISVAAWSKSWVCSHSDAGIVGSSAGGSMDVCLL